jgi:preprotein translocase subunit YajC
MATWKHCFWICLWTCLSVNTAWGQEGPSISVVSGSQVATPASTTPAGVADRGAGSSSASSPASSSGSIKVSKQPASIWEEFLSNPLWLMMAMFLVFYVGVVLPSQRSNKRQQRELSEMISNLKKNDRIVTSFGVHGVVVSTQPDAGTVTIRLDENTNAKMTVNRDTIRVVKKD